MATQFKGYTVKRLPNYKGSFMKVITVESYRRRLVLEFRIEMKMSLFTRLSLICGLIRNQSDSASKSSKVFGRWGVNSLPVLIHHKDWTYQIYQMCNRGTNVKNRTTTMRWWEAKKSLKWKIHPGQRILNASKVEPQKVVFRLWVSCLFTFFNFFIFYHNNPPESLKAGCNSFSNPFSLVWGLPQSFTA